MAWLRETRTGKRSVVEAVFEANSVRMATNEDTTKAITTWGLLCRKLNCSPIQADSPESCGFLRDIDGRAKEFYIGSMSMD